MRVIPIYPYVFRPGKIVLQESDAYYHIRHIEHLVRNFPDRFDWDPYGVYPGGQSSFTAPLFDYLVGTVAWVSGFGAPSQYRIEAVAAWFPAVLGALIPIAVFMLGRALFSATAGLVAACLMAVLPGHYLRISSLGFTDHHVLETLTSTLVLYFLVRLLQSEGESGPVRRRWTVWFGLALWAYVCTWVGGAMIVAVLTVWAAGACLVRHWRGGPSAPFCHPIAIGYLFAFTLFLPAYGVRWSEFTLLALGGGATGLVAVSSLAGFLQKRGYARGLFYLVLAGVGALAVSMAAVRWPAAMGQGLNQLRHLAPEGAMSSIQELQPLLRSGVLATMSGVWNQFTSAGFIAMPALWWLVAGSRWSMPQSLTMFLFYSAFMMSEAMLELRTCYYAVVPVSLLTGYACGELVRGSRNRCVLAGVLVALGVIAPNIAHRLTTPVAVGGPSQDWQVTLEWLRTHTPDPFPDPKFYLRPYPASALQFSYPPSVYSIMNWWDEGHWINYVARRIPVSNPHQMGAEVAARFYLSQNEAEAGAIMESVTARYVVADPLLLTWVGLVNGRAESLGRLGSVQLWSGYQNKTYATFMMREVVEGVYEPLLLYTPEYYRTMSARLCLFNGKAVTPANSTWVITAKKHPIANDYSVINTEQRFATYQEAVDFLAKSKEPTARLVGLNPRLSCVPLEASPSFHFEFDSRPGARAGELMGVKVFSYAR